MQVHVREVGPFAENSYVLACEKTRQAAIIDPGEAEPMLEILRDEKLTPLFILNTHAHIDHVLGVAELQDALGLPFYLHPAEALWVASLAQQAAMFGLPRPAVPRLDREHKGGDRHVVGEIEIGVLDVPGHSPGHVALLVAGAAAIFSGDCVFAGSIGRTDLPGGDHEQLLRSIRTHLLTLPGETVIYPGHGPATTVGHERFTNPFLVEA